ncbi:hypothetical protein [Megalodesulfovibrio gigas]|uniref:SGNH/GDSL hydrolase family protein n=1 Tax=Megalodesulfovibrio gigas (strain ATCC 19364 / DSM 1382 / NCIMB 9332 / VKM B-1759) TaxID=1121448 RepID=T2GGI7_MEGG1|nr:hypothetical protein [Megalodesulfovibrio gigas]AGW15252.1 hypothetical protein DGI_4040 [Megalodesulfovibrio gigas DSM 1382 = ATCC 19364]
MNPIALVMFGHSHVGCVLNTSRQRKVDGFTWTIIPIIEANRWQVQASTFDAARNLYIGNSVVMNSLQAHGAFTEGRRVVVSFCGGNVHNSLGLLEHQRKFDFVVPYEPDLPLDPAAELIPYDMMYEQFKLRNQGYLGLLSHVARETRHPFVHMESPPPIPDHDFIVSTLDPTFKERAKTTGITSAILRYKLWRCNSHVYADHCRQENIRFVETPACVKDAQGFLLKEGWKNATHGNEWYGAKIMEHIEALAASSLKG